MGRGLCLDFNAVKQCESRLGLCDKYVRSVAGDVIYCSQWLASYLTYIIALLTNREKIHDPIVTG